MIQDPDSDSVFEDLLALAGGFILTMAAVSGCSPLAAGQPDAVHASAYVATELDCVEQADAKPAALACVAAVRRDWCLQFPQAPNCIPPAYPTRQTDGGAQ